MSRWTRFFIAIAVGIGLGLLYGWVVSPIEYVDTTPGTLRIDYKADYVLMVAEAYQEDGDLALAVRRLALLQEMPLSDLAYRAVLFAQKVGYSDQDVSLIEALHRDLAAYDASQENPGDQATPSVEGVQPLPETSLP